jgi:hypothetical protein
MGKRVNPARAIKRGQVEACLPPQLFPLGYWDFRDFFIQTREIGGHALDAKFFVELLVNK